jgi:alkyl hydroperoxide reductase subunit AhpC
MSRGPLLSKGVFQYYNRIFEGYFNKNLSFSPTYLRQFIIKQFIAGNFSFSCAEEVLSKSERYKTFAETAIYAVNKSFFMEDAQSNAKY